MTEIRVADVSNGSCVSLVSDANNLQIDCGKANSPTSTNAFQAWEGFTSYPNHSTESFLLSHFHLDHYNGLAYGAHKDKRRLFSISRAYFPRIPDFPSLIKQLRNEFYRAVQFLNAVRISFGTGLAEWDFMQMLSRINSTKFLYRSLSNGDIFCNGSDNFLVVWPPRTVPDTLEHKVSKVLERFQEFLDSNEEISDLYEKIRDRIIVYDDGTIAEDEDTKSVLKFELKDKSSQPLFNKIFNEMKEIANELSIAFVSVDETKKTADGRIVFFGDLQGNALKTVFEKVFTLRKHYKVCLAAHHGTKIPNSILQIGRQYFGKVFASQDRRFFGSSEWKTYTRICSKAISTYKFGSVVDSY